MDVKANLHYNKTLRIKANALRKDMTKAEACLWKYVLKAGKMKCYSFSRQRPVLKYIADFMCKKLNLIIEVDGLSHHDYDVQKADSKRQRDLEQLGFIVIRFTDEDVLRDMVNVIRVIENTIEQIKKVSFPPPAPSGSGRT